MLQQHNRKTEDSHLEWRFWRMGMSEQADGLVAGWCLFWKRSKLTSDNDASTIADLSAAQFVHGQIE